MVEGGEKYVFTLLPEPQFVSTIKWHLGLYCSNFKNSLGVVRSVRHIPKFCTLIKKACVIFADV